MIEAVEKKANYFYFLFRILVGILFFLHGWAKLPGIIGGTAPTMMAWAGIIELTVGPLIVLGLFIRYAAIVGAVEMLFAYYIAHWPNGISPLANRGEPALLFFASFMILIAYGAKKWSVDKYLENRAKRAERENSKK